MPRPTTNIIFDQQGEIVSQICSRCKHPKDLEEFHGDKSNKTTGKQRYCKACSQARYEEYYSQGDPKKRVTLTLNLGQYRALAARARAAGERPGDLAGVVVSCWLEGTLAEVGTGADAAQALIDEVDRLAGAEVEGEAK